MLLEQLSDFLGRRRRTTTREHRAIAADQELREVPGDVLVALLVRMAVLQELVEIAGSVSVYLDLREHREVDVVLGADEVQDLFVAARLLGAELVARKAEDAEAPGLVLVV